MNARYTFRLHSDKPARRFPHKIIIGQSTTETTTHVLLKFLGYVLFFRERLQLEVNLDLDHVPFTPDLVQLDYALRPALWVECGECSVQKLHKLAVKLPEPEIWVLKRGEAEARQLKEAMVKKAMRTGRYGVIGFDSRTFGELLGLLSERSEFYWVSGSIEPPRMQFEFNSLWFDTEFAVFRH